MSRMTRKVPVEDLPFVPRWIVTGPRHEDRVFAFRSREHPPYVPGQWERDRDERVERGEVPPRTDPPPRESDGEKRDFAQVQADATRIASRGANELSRLRRSRRRRTT
jgi:hypothetical protein